MSTYLSMQDKRPTPVLDADGKRKDFMLTVGGKPYRCLCGCNVFHKPDASNPNIYECNACEQQFEGG
jgi:hypothetical protein